MRWIAIDLALSAPPRETLDLLGSWTLAVSSHSRAPERFEAIEDQGGNKGELLGRKGKGANPPLPSWTACAGLSPRLDGDVPDSLLARLLTEVERRSEGLHVLATHRV